jgi:short-subunit dehydrogenase
MSGFRDYAGKVAVVTGASSGIGEATARELARRGMRVALVARRRERLAELADRIAKTGGSASVHACDVADRAAVEAAFAEITRAHGGVDLLVNNAGYVKHTLFANHSLDDIERMTRVNYLGSVYWIKLAIPVLRQRGGGAIVNLSSLAGILPQCDEAAYSAAKAAISALSEVLFYELEPYKIHVLAVHPGLVRTEMFTPEEMARMPKGSEGRFLEPDDFVAQMLGALEKGEASVVIPRAYRIAVWLKNAIPALGRGTASQRLKVLPDFPG